MYFSFVCRFTVFLCSRLLRTMLMSVFPKFLLTTIRRLSRYLSQQLDPSKLTFSVFFCALINEIYHSNMLIYSKLQYLALQDLALLSQHSPSRRTEVFSLSQPGVYEFSFIFLSFFLSFSSKLNAFLSPCRWSSPLLERHQSGVSVPAHWSDPETRGLSRHCCNQWQAQIPVPRQREEDFIRQILYDSVGPIIKWFNVCCSFTIVWPILWLSEQYHQGRRICSVPGQHQCFPALSLGPLRPRRPLWRSPSLQTSTAPLPFPPCAVWLLLRNSTRQPSAPCRALISWGEAQNSGPPPQVSGVNECYSRWNGNLSQRMFAKWIFFFLIFRPRLLRKSLALFCFFCFFCPDHKKQKIFLFVWSWLTGHRLMTQVISWKRWLGRHIRKLGIGHI